MCRIALILSGVFESLWWLSLIKLSCCLFYDGGDVVGTKPVMCDMLLPSARVA